MLRMLTAICFGLPGLLLARIARSSDLEAIGIVMAFSLPIGWVLFYPHNSSRQTLDSQQGASDAASGNVPRQDTVSLGKRLCVIGPCLLLGAFCTGWYAVAG